jgi:lipopolysaccharide/colanic/teichoic acid biosynthesis glycosyltransferase
VAPVEEAEVHPAARLTESHTLHDPDHHSGNGSAQGAVIVDDGANGGAGNGNGSGTRIANGVAGSAPTNTADGADVAVDTDRPTLDNFVRVIGPYERYGKRLVDVAVSFLLLVVLLPLLATIALAVRLSMGSKVLFFQDRVGRDGRTIRMVKFRSMRHDRRIGAPNTFDGPDRRRTHKTVNDPRHTVVGRFIRKWSLDELPQLWNVLRGDMSLVGPRPELVQVAQRYGLVDHARHLVRPGITGLWQVSKERTALLHENVHIDLDYVERITFAGDAKILLRTFGSVVRIRGS